ncbi:MAG: hypothetical protein ACLRWF_01460 [Ruthenibacterium sp.]
MKCIETNRMLIAAAAQLGAVASGARRHNKMPCASLPFPWACVPDGRRRADVVSTTQELGKPVGSDAQNGKTTFVTLHGVEGTRALAARTTAEACRMLASTFGENAGFLCAFAQSLISRTT